MTEKQHTQLRKHYFIQRRKSIKQNFLDLCMRKISDNLQMTKHSQNIRVEG